jgi:hypothetical protein
LFFFLVVPRHQEILNAFPTRCLSPILLFHNQLITNSQIFVNDHQMVIKTEMSPLLFTFRSPFLIFSAAVPYTVFLISPDQALPPRRTAMSPTPTYPQNPSQAVERIREIIVGRHLEKLELRVACLESTAASSPMPAAWEDRLCHGEARLEALQQGLQRLADSTREDAEHRALEQRAEIQRLASQIQQVAAAKAAEVEQPALNRLEHKIGTWLTNWQSSLHTHLNDREQRLAAKLRQEAATLWENTESQITRLQSRMVDSNEIEERFTRITAAALALAESASPLRSHFHPDNATH